MAGNWHTNRFPNFRPPLPPRHEHFTRSPNFRPRYSGVPLHEQRVVRPRIAHVTHDRVDGHGENHHQRMGAPMHNFSPRQMDNSFPRGGASTSMQVRQITPHLDTRMYNIGGERDAEQPITSMCSDLQQSRKTLTEGLAEEKTLGDEENQTEWLQLWLTTKSSNTPRENLKTEISIPESKAVLRKAFVLVEQLKALRGSMNSESSVDATREVPDVIQEANRLKRELDDLREVISAMNVTEHLKKKMERAKKKRARLKRRRKRLYEEKQEEEEERERRHREIDQWQERIYEQVQETKMEDELKDIADKTLGEVRREVGEASRALDALRAVKKLRAARKQGLEQTGLYVSRESDVIFEQRHEALVAMMTKQLRKYQEEQRLLQVMLDSEKAELKEHEEEERAREREDQQEREERDIRASLFGSQEEHGPGDPVYNHFLYYDVANRSELDLVRIRREWDAFLVPDHSPEGTCIPPGWVQPVSPSSRVWASALQSEPD